MTRGGVHLMRGFVAATVVSVALSALVVQACCADARPSLVALGLAAVILNGMAAHIINGFALRAGTQHSFLTWSLAGNGLRAMALLTFMLAGHIKLGANAAPILATVLTGYFTFMVFEISYLHRHAAPAECSA